VAPGAPSVAAAPQAAPGATYELQEAIRPPLAIGPGQQYQMQEQPGVVRGDPRSTVASLPADYRPETGPRKELPPQFRRALVDYRTKEPAGTIIIDTPSTYLYLVMGNGKAMRYGIGVGREGFTWTGVEKVTRMAEWPDWNPPPEMIERQPYLPRFMAGGETNPLGARALYLGKTIYRIHGTNQPSTIGTFVSSGCIRLTNEDVEDLYTRVKVGTRVVVMPGVKPPVSASVAPNVPPPSANAVRPAPLPPPISVR
jgi:lipoprotein-anchoring transpeptidase ErfK/SrfK